MGNSSSHSVSQTIKKNQEYISDMNKIKVRLRFRFAASFLHHCEVMSDVTWLCIFVGATWYNLVTLMVYHTSSNSSVWCCLFLVLADWILSFNVDEVFAGAVCYYKSECLSLSFLFLYQFLVMNFNVWTDTSTPQLCPCPLLRLPNTLPELWKSWLKFEFSSHSRWIVGSKCTIR